MDSQQIWQIAALAIIHLSLFAVCNAGTCSDTVPGKLGCVCGVAGDCGDNAQCVAGYCQQTEFCDDSSQCDAPFACVTPWPGSPQNFCSYCTPAGAPVSVSKGCCSGLKPTNPDNECVQPTSCTKDIECARLEYYWIATPMMWYCDRCIDGQCVVNLDFTTCPSGPGSRQGNKSGKQLTSLHEAHPKAVTGKPQKAQTP